MEALWIDLKELRESVKALSIQTYKTERRVARRKGPNNTQKRSSSLAHPYRVHEHGQLFTISQVYCFIAVCNIAMASFIFLTHCFCLRYVYVNRTQVQEMVDEQLRSVQNGTLVAHSVEEMRSSTLEANVTHTEDVKLAELKSIKLEVEPAKEMDDEVFLNEDEYQQNFLVEKFDIRKENCAASLPYTVLDTPTESEKFSEQTNSVRSSLSETDGWIVKKQKKKMRKINKKNEPKMANSSNVFMHLIDA